MENLIVGIDPGFTGGIVVLHGNTLLDRIEVPNDRLETKYVMPTLTIGRGKQEIDEDNLVWILGCFHKLGAKFILEKARSMPGQGVAGVFSFGTGYGIIKGVLAALYAARQEVAPATWHRTIFKDMPKIKKEGKGNKKAIKDRSRSLCHKLWPSANFLATSRSRVAHDGLCDAALIAEYARREIWHAG